ncbi:MAG: zinc-binding dehydrogenase, partial [Planctomycetota bacterium]
SAFKEGDAVLALTRFGGYSEKIVISASQAFPIPKQLSFEKAAAIPVNYLTAWLMLISLGNVQAGDQVLIHAVAGGVGQAAVQICQWKGATIFGTASASKHERLKQLGVSVCIDYHTQDFEQEIRRTTNQRGVDIVLDAVGGKSFQKSYRCLAPLGRLFLFGVSSFAPGQKRRLLPALKGLAQMPKFKPIPLMNENRGVMGVNLGHLWAETEKLYRAFHEILHCVESKKFDPLVDQVFPFEKAAEAHHYIQSHRNFGKVLLVP